jgi:hypothetical protein
MAVMIDLTLNGIVLDAGLLWADEFEWSPVVQKTQRALDGTLVVSEAALKKGRPITLTGGADHGWVPRSALEQLYALLGSVPPLVLQLADGRSFDVRWRHAEKPIDARALRELALPSPSDPYVVTLKLITV